MVVKLMHKSRKDSDQVQITKDERGKAERVKDWEEWADRGGVDHVGVKVRMGGDVTQRDGVGGCEGSDETLWGNERTLWL